MIISAINVSKDPRCFYPLGRTSLFLSHLLLKQEVRRGRTKYPLAETPQLSNDLCRLLFLAFNLTVNTRAKRLLRLCSMSALLSLFQFLHLHQVRVLRPPAYLY
jgi:hypothetical protein